MTRLVTAKPRAAAALLLALGLATPASAGSRLEDLAAEGGLGIAAATATALYAPIKVFIGGAGIMTAGAAWALTGGDRALAMTIAERTVGGDWLVTQAHLRGERDFDVLGPSERDVARSDADR